MGASDTAKEIWRLESVVRQHISTHRYQTELLEDSSTWNQICSSLDTIGDTLSAINSYLSTEFPENQGLRYIYSYGILQALFLQQDALRHLTEAFGLEHGPNEALRDIRIIRNASIGHPTKHNHGGICYRNFISRHSMAKEGFDLLRHFGSREFELLRVNLLALIDDQLKGIKEGYEQIALKLQEEDRMHKEKFKGDPTSDIFHSAMGYCFEKIGGAIRATSSGDREFGLLQLHLVRKTYEKFEAALRERNELNSYTEYDLLEYLHALKKLESYLTGEKNGMEEADARIYLSYLRNEHDHFVRLAKEIDDSYLEGSPEAREPVAIEVKIEGIND